MSVKLTTFFLFWCSLWLLLDGTAHFMERAVCSEVTMNVACDDVGICRNSVFLHKNPVLCGVHTPSGSLKWLLLFLSSLPFLTLAELCCCHGNLTPLTVANLQVVAIVVAAEQMLLVLTCCYASVCDGEEHTKELSETELLNRSVAFHSLWIQMFKTLSCSAAPSSRFNHLVSKLLQKQTIERP